jgi:hypothetical protein
MDQTYTEWPYIIPNGYDIYQHLPLQDPSKFTQLGYFWFENMPAIWQPWSGSKKTRLTRKASHNTSETN